MLYCNLAFGAGTKKSGEPGSSTPSEGVITVSFYLGETSLWHYSTPRAVIAQSV
jgi:hypothetical protein